MSERAGTRYRRWAEARYGPWDKSQERYADGTTVEEARRDYDVEVEANA